MFKQNPWFSVNGYLLQGVFHSVDTILKGFVTKLWFQSDRVNGQFQKISIPNHGRLPCFNPPLPSEIPEYVTPPCPQNSIIVNPPYPSEFPGFFGKYIFDLATFIWTNEHEFMPPKGCYLAAPGDKLYSSATRITYRVWPGCATFFLSLNLPIKKHHLQ